MVQIGFWRRNSSSVLRGKFSSDVLLPAMETSVDRALFSPALRSVLLVLFVAALIYVIPSAATYHGDERFYTDASLRMMQSGDYWTPYFSDGRIRLLKPVLTYWVIVASFKSLGIGLLASRLPFVIAGALILVVSYQLARTVLHCRQTALLGAAILASNFEFITLCSRATPDILLCLFVLMSMWGFAQIWFQDDRTLLGPTLVFVGTGLAVQTKGLLGICPLAANLIFALISRPGWERIRRLLRWEAIMTGLVIGLFWYVVMWSRHGSGALMAFFSDQVTTRVENNTGSMIVNLVVYLFAGFRHFLPWTLLVVVVLVWRWQDAIDHWRRRKAEWLFLLLMFAILVILFSMGNIIRPRYLIASYPFLALFLADIIVVFWSQPRLQQLLGRLIVGIVFLFLPVGVLLLVAGLILGDWRLIVGGGLLLSLTVTGWRIRDTRDDGSRWIWLAGASLGIFALIGGCIRPVFSPPSLESVAEVLMQSSAWGGTVHTWGLNYSETGVLRVLTGGRLDIREVSDEQAAGANFNSASIVITASPREQALATAGYRVTRVVEPGTPFEQTHFGQLVRVKARRAHNRPVPEYWIAVRQP